MKELFTLMHILRLKPVDFTNGVHRQISPKYIAWRNLTRIDFFVMKEQCMNAAEAIQSLGISFEQVTLQIKMINSAFAPYYKQYIEGLRLQYSRYHECLNSPLWR